mmetsp:Transcript_89015/g.154389  ORF Transcript_89015/g.154389 Transcript_89015/m.154389 type:complete len:381 (-) Transcript_89015:896-2038(-)
MADEHEDGWVYFPEYNDSSAWNTPAEDDIEDSPWSPDDDFPEDDSSCGAITVAGHLYKDVSRSYTWCSAKKVMKCVGGWDGCMWWNMSVNDIAQGAIGDCWFIAAIAGAAENPALLKLCFPGNEGELDESDNYTVRLFDPDDGMAEKHIQINDHIPCTVNNGIYKPAFARPTGNEIYVLLLEKALAKMLGSYAALVGGWTWLGYTYLFGCEKHEKFAFKDGAITKYVITADCISRSGPTATNHGSIDADEAWAYVEDCATNYWTLCSTAWNGAGLESIAPDTGLVSGHAYTVTKAVTTSSGYKLLQCRNPWGGKEWGSKYPNSCPWSDHSPLWEQHPDVAEEVGFEGPQEDGLFWIPWDLFREHGLAIVLSWVPSAQQPG